MLTANSIEISCVLSLPCSSSCEECYRQCQCSKLISNEVLFHLFSMLGFVTLAYMFSVYKKDNILQSSSAPEKKSSHSLEQNDDD